MASLLKNQILKHLSRFAKNLSSDKLQLSTFRGQCELHNLELNEQVLSDLLELPSFLQLKRAVCNHVVVKIHWTKLKSVPICVLLDEVMIEIETCEDVQAPSRPASRSSYSSGGKYGFSDRVIDGMTVTANSVSINFNSPVFQASFQLSRLVLESRSPSWKKVDLRSCRVKHAEKGEVLLFKHLEWQVLRIEAKAVDNKCLPLFLKTTPLRLITNQAVCRITMKKKLSDCSVLGSRIVLVMDDLLWVLTDIQLLAAIHFLRSLVQLMEAGRKPTHKEVPMHVAEHLMSPLVSKQIPINHQSPIHKIFSQCNVIEPSYHLFTKRIDFHLCDDAKDGRSQHSSLKDGGALQISLCNLAIDYYPYHVPSRGREHWLRYKEPSSGRSSWIQQLMNLFQEQLSTVFNTEKKEFSPSPSFHTPTDDLSVNIHPPLQQRRSTGGANQLMSTCLVLRLGEFFIYKITTSETKKKKRQEAFLASDKVSLLLPEDMKAVHMEWTQYYYPVENHLPVPPPNMYAHLGPLQLEVHNQTIFWLNAFILNFKKCIDPLMTKAPSAPVLGIRIEALMPQILLPHRTEASGNPHHPKYLQIQASRVITTNCRVGEFSTRMSLSQCLDSLSQGDFFRGTLGFPFSDSDMKVVAGRFYDHVVGNDSCQTTGYVSEDGSPLTDHEIRDVWSIQFDPLWVDFIAEEFGKKRHFPFMDAIPLTVWIWNKPIQDLDCTFKESNNENSSNANVECDVNVLLHLKSIVKIQLNHYQYLFLIGMFDNLLELNLQLRKDTMAILGPECVRTMCLAISVPLFEVSLVLQTETQHIVVSPSCCTDSESMLQEESPTEEQKLISTVGSAIKLATAQEQTEGRRESTIILQPMDDSDRADGPYGRDKSPACSNCSRNCVLPKSCSDSIVDSGIQAALTLDKQAEVIQKGVQTSTAAVKKGFSSLVASIDSMMSNKALGEQTTNIALQADSDNLSCCDEDAMSIRSDLSSDSDQFVLVGADSFTNDDEFFHAHNVNATADVEVASEMKEDSISLVTISNSDKKHDVLTVLMVKVFNVKLVNQSVGAQSTILLENSQISTSEYSAISWSDFQNNFTAKYRGLKESEDSESINCPRVRLRMIQDGESGQLDMRINDIDVGLNKSFLPLLTAMLESEASPMAMATTVQIENIKLRLIHDFPNGESAMPTVFHIPSCRLERSLDGLTQLLPVTVCSGTSGVIQKAINEVKSDSPSRRLSSSSSSSETPKARTIDPSQNLENIRLQSELDLQKRENALLKARLDILMETCDERELRLKLIEAKDEIRKLEEEKKKLSQTIMQIEISKVKADG